MCGPRRWNVDASDVADLDLLVLSFGEAVGPHLTLAIDSLETVGRVNPALSRLSHQTVSPFCTSTCVASYVIELN